MPQYRYDGPSHVLKMDEDDKGVAKGGLGTYSAAFVKRMTDSGHRFTEGESLNNNQMEAAKAVNRKHGSPTEATPNMSVADSEIAANNPTPSASSSSSGKK